MQHSALVRIFERLAELDPKPAYDIRPGSLLRRLRPGGRQSIDLPTILEGIAHGLDEKTAVPLPGRCRLHERHNVMQRPSWNVLHIQQSQSRLRHAPLI